MSDSVLSMPTRALSDIEPWIGAEIVAAHLGFTVDHIRKLANRGVLPGRVAPGRRRFWRFRLSEVDRAWASLAAPIASPVADKKIKAAK